MNKQESTDNARDLRRNMTKEERRLWYDFLKKQPYTVNRQKPFGKYILDFFIAKAKIAIEIDGSRHFTKQGVDEDKQRDKYLKDRGITVLRYSDYSVDKHFNDMCEDIKKHVASAIKPQELD